MRILFQLLLILVFVAVASLSYAKDLWYCPMHTHYTSEKPGSCPICGMTLVKRMDDADKANGSAIVDHAAVHLNNDQQKLLGITTVKAVKQPLKRMIRASGYVSTMNELFLLQDAYIKAYIEYVQAFRDQKRFKHGRKNWDSHREVQVKLHNAQEELLRFGLSTAEIEKLQKYSWQTPWDQPGLSFFKEGINYWVVAAIYEQDLGYLESGQMVDMEIPAFHEHIKGQIRTIGKLIDPQTRTVNALIEVQGYRGELVGNMFVNVVVDVTLNDHVMVPKDALLDTGIRKIIFVEDKAGVFTPKEVTDVVPGDNGWGINAGIAEGDMVVVQGNFLLDSESRMQSSLQGGGQ